VGLKRSLNAIDLIFYGVGSSVGAGIYCLIGIGAELAGPGIALSFLSCGIACIFTSLAYAEFAARIPVTGSAYIYAYVSFGEFYGWIVGWFLTLGYGFTASAVARSWAEYSANFLRNVLESLIPGSNDDYVILEYLTKLPLPFLGEGYTCSPLSTVVIALGTVIQVIGAKESTKFNNAMTFLNISVLAFVVFAGFGTQTVNIDNLQPFFPHGIGGVAQGAGLAFFSFIGFDMVACLSEEVINPERNMPIGIVGSILICTGIYVIITLVVVGLAPVNLLGQDVPITNALFANACCTHEEQLLENAAGQCLNSMCAPILHSVMFYGGRFVSFGAIFGLTSGTFTSLMGQPRIWYRMAQDGLFFPIFGRVNEVTQVPTAGMIITGIGAALLACFVELSALASLISLGTLMVFTFVCAGVIVLRLCPDLTKSSSPFEDDCDNSSACLCEHSTILFHLKTCTELIFGRSSRRLAQNNGSKPILFILLYTLSAVIGFIVIANEWHSATAYVAFAITMMSALAIMSMPKLPPPETFSCPLVPLIPLLGILSNAYMMGSLPLVAWGFAAVWFAMGAIVYFAYGIRHSSLQSRHSIDNQNESAQYQPLCLSSENLVGYDSTK